jgi:hypothetical protein
MRHGKQKTAVPIKMPERWAPTRAAGSRMMDLVVPTLLGALGLCTLGLIVFTLGILTGLIPWH